MVDDSNCIFQLSNFGWVGEPTSAAEVSVATKSDDAKVNMELWVVVELVQS